MNNYKIFIIKTALFVFHLEISGKVHNDEHNENIPLKSITLFIFHFDISGNDNKFEQLQKI